MSSVAVESLANVRVSQFDVSQLKSDEQALQRLQNRATTVEHETNFAAVAWLIDQFSRPVSQQDFCDVYNAVFGHPFQIEDFPPYSDFIEVIASIPGIIRQKDEDSQAVYLCNAKHIARLDRDAVYQEPAWAFNCKLDKLPTIFLKTKWTIRAFKDEKQIDFLDLKSFIGPFGEVPSSFLIFGRGEHVDYLMCHPSISRVHAVLQFDCDGNLFIYDMSTHGTFVNGVRIERETYIQLQQYASIKFGESSREYVLNISPDRSYAPPRETQSSSSDVVMTSLSANSAPHADAVVEEPKQKTTVSEIQSRLATMNLDDINEEMMDIDEEQTNDENSERIFVVQGIDFRQLVHNLEQLTVVNLKLYTTANSVSVPSKLRKAELVSLIRRDIEKFI